MRRLAFLALLTAGLLPGAARADAPALGGLLCGFASGPDLTGPQYAQTGVMQAGPLGFEDPGISVTCTLQVGAANSTHRGSDAVVLSGPVAPYVAVLPPSPIGYSAAPDDNVYLCTTVTDSTGGTLYWDDANDPFGGGVWSYSVDASCRLAIQLGDPVVRVVPQYPAGPDPLGPLPIGCQHVVVYIPGQDPIGVRVCPP